MARPSTSRPSSTTRASTMPNHFASGSLAACSTSYSLVPSHLKRNSFHRQNDSENMNDIFHQKLKKQLMSYLIQTRLDDSSSKMYSIYPFLSWKSRHEIFEQSQTGFKLLQRVSRHYVDMSFYL